VQLLGSLPNTSQEQTGRVMIDSVDKMGSMEQDNLTPSTSETVQKRQLYSLSKLKQIV
jgi:hypothetical protein